MNKSLQVVLLVLTALSASARPYLQLKKTTDGGSQTISLTALVDALAPNATGTFYIAAAIVPAPAHESQIGSFRFDGMPVRATNDMIFGTPARQKAGQTYPTWYREFSFSFNRAQRTLLYDVNSPDAPAKPMYHSGGDALFREFTVDVSNLPPGTQLEFNLYSAENPRRKHWLSRLFGRDNDTVPPIGNDPTRNGSGPAPVPDSGATLILCGLGLAGLSLVARRLMGR